uniref:Cytochrome b6-f complex subunit 6 n=1 Tax=Halophila beccarii TaxID=180123 RepID=A0A7G7YEE7_9LILI|nr:cytochrome b6/f complex subunit VI [Halophila beccarii]QNH92867.1 cytochrome b6/f complex subunit VI [Halophila beccarii]
MFIITSYFGFLLAASTIASSLFIGFNKIGLL